MLENHPLLNIVQGFSQLDFEYSEQLLAALIPMSFTVIFHAMGMGVVGLYLKRFGLPLLHGAHVTARIIVMTGIVGITLVSHLFEIAIWAVFYLGTGLLPNAHKAMFFSMESYTTLGASNITLSGRWLGFEGFEAMTGMLMFGWSTAILAAVVMKFHSIDD